MNEDNLHGSPMPGVTNPGGNESTDFSSTPRYASTDEMRSEFGDYRVNLETDNLTDTQKPTDVGSDVAKNDPFANEAAGTK